MKIYASFCNIDSVQFTSRLIDALKQNMPKNCRVRENQSRYAEIRIDNCPSFQRLYKAVLKSIDDMGYLPYEVNEDGYNIAAVDERSLVYVLLAVDFGSYYGNDSCGYVDMKFHNGTASSEDWYDDPIDDGVE